MDNKIVKVIFKEGWETMYSNDLTKCDYGQVLQIEGITIPEGNVEVHFSLTEHNGEAPISVGTVKDNVITVDIPDFILQKKDVYTDSYQAYAWIYVTDGESGRTIRKIVFTIDTRAEPTTNVPEDKKDSFLQEVRQVMAETKKVAQSVRDDADNGKFNGSQGLSGKDGKDGEDGQDGEDGKSAYDYAVEGGFKGTEQEFIDLMAQAGHVDLTGYVTKEQHEAELIKAMVKVTTEPSPFHHITDSANMKVLDFGMEGITEQKQYEGKNWFDLASAEIKKQYGINDDTGEVYWYGNGNAIVNFTKILPNTEYVLYAKQITYPYGSVILYFYDSEKNYLGKDTRVSTSNTTLIPYEAVKFTTHENAHYCRMWYGVSDINTLQIELGTEVTDFEQYVGSMPSPNPEYEQPITLAGVLNEETGRYEHKCVISDESEENSQPFTLTSPVPLTKWDKLVKREGKWYWDYKQLKLVVDGSNLEFYDDTWRGFRIKNLLPEVMSRRDGYCTQLRVDYGNANPEDVQNHMWLGVANQHLYIIGSSFYDSELDDKGLANFKAHLNEHPLEIYTYKDESELVPLLDEEQELLHNLETYYGVTNLYNEQGCPMWLTYVTDTKLYVDQKLLEIQQAII